MPSNTERVLSKVSGLSSIIGAPPGISFPPYLIVQQKWLV